MGREVLLIDLQLEPIDLRPLQRERCRGLIALRACGLHQRFGLGELLLVGRPKEAVGWQLGHFAQDAADLGGLCIDAEARCQAGVEAEKECLVDLCIGGARDAAGRDEGLVAAQVFLVEERACDDNGVFRLLVSGALGVDLGEDGLDRGREIADAGTVVAAELGDEVDEVSPFKVTDARATVPALPPDFIPRTATKRLGPARVSERFQAFSW